MFGTVATTTSTRRRRAAAVAATALVGSLAIAASSSPASAQSQQQTFYFHGGSDDQANKAQFQPSATFSATAPTSTDPLGVTQTAEWPNDGPDFAQSAFDVFWQGSFTGTLSGSISFDWWWSTGNPGALASPGNATVTVFADPTADEATGEIAQSQVTLNVGATPTENHTTIQLGSGATSCPCTVDSQLLIEVSTTDVDPSGTELTAHYDSTAVRSSFAVTTGDAVSPSPTPTPTSTDGASSGQVTYVGTQETAQPASEPVNALASTPGPPVVLQTSAIGRESGEPTVGVTKSGTVFFPGDTFDTPGGEAARNLEMRSTDGGLTWTDVSPTVANVGNGANTHPATLDTITYVDKDYNRVFTVDTLAAEGSVLSYSDDEGKTWTTSFAAAAGVNDHETITTGVVPAGSGLVTIDPNFPKIVYYCVNTVAAVSCSRSLDGGLTFTQMNSPFPTHPTQKLPLSALCSSLTGHIQTDSKGDLFVHSAWNEVAGCGVPAIAVSKDGGTTWQDFTVSSAIKDDFNQTSLSIDTAGNLYDVWQDDKYNLPYLSVSKDLGATWSTPVMIAPPGVKVTNFPDVVAGDPGRIAISFPGSGDATANTDGTNAPWSYYVAFSNNALDASPTFTSQIAQIPASLGGGTVMHRGACNARCGGLFDFLDIQIAPTPGGAAYASLSDDCTGACAKRPDGASDDAAAGQGILVREIAGPAQTGPNAVLDSGVGPNLPESPWPALLPALAMVVGAGLFMRRGRRRRKAT